MFEKVREPPLLLASTLTGVGDLLSLALFYEISK